MFDNFPKQRPFLPEGIRAIYSEHYKSNRGGKTVASSLSQKMESWLHRQIAKDLASAETSDQATLELGAGNLNQLRYELGLQVYDIVEPFTELYENSLDRNRIRNFFTDISEVPAAARYDRITSVATLEHICNLPEIVAQSALLLMENGVFRASIPSEGTVLWTLGWKLTTGLEFRLKYNLDYGQLMKYEHVNSAGEIEDVLECFFQETKCRVFGLSKAFSLYRFYECRKPAKERCREYLQQLQKT